MVMETDIIFRRAQLSDSGAILNILSKSFRSFQHYYTVKAYDATVISIIEIEKRMIEGPSWLAIEDGFPIASLSGIIKENEFYIRGMAVLPNSRGKGVGHSLLIMAEEFAKGNHCSSLILSTTPYLRSARHLYEKYGFSIINEAPYHLFETPLFNMRKKLD